MNEMRWERWGAASGFAAVSFQTQAFPAWLAWLSVVTAAANLVPLLGIVVKSGPLAPDGWITAYAPYPVFVAWLVVRDNHNAQTDREADTGRLSRWNLGFEGGPCRTRRPRTGVAINPHFHECSLFVRSGKGRRDRVTFIASTTVRSIREERDHIE